MYRAYRATIKQAINQFRAGRMQIKLLEVGRSVTLHGQAGHFHCERYGYNVVSHTWCAYIGLSCVLSGVHVIADAVIRLTAAVKPGNYIYAEIFI